LISFFFHLGFVFGPVLFEFLDSCVHVDVIFTANTTFSCFFLLEFELRDTLVESLDILVEGIVTLTRLLGRLLEFLAFVTVLLQDLLELDFFLEFDFVLLSVSFSLLFNFSFLLVNLLVNLLLNVVSGIFLVS
jgi:hypothetical protein